METVQNENKREGSKCLQLCEGDWIADYEIVKLISSGEFAAIYEVRHVNSLPFALKIEDREAANKSLKMEVTVLQALEQLHSPHFCRYYFCARTTHLHVVVMSLNGRNLNELRRDCPNQRLKIYTAMNVAKQSLDAIQMLHSIGYIHRDIKPGNICISLENPRIIKLLDFGMARKYLDKKRQLLNPRWYSEFKGTIRYASLASHNGRENSRKDDLESWLYVVVEMLVGTLPWYTIEDIAHVAQSKQHSRTRYIREFFSGCPKQLIHILLYIDSLSFYDAPDYAMIRGLILKALSKAKEPKHGRYDWEKIAIFIPPSSSSPSLRVVDINSSATSVPK